MIDFYAEGYAQGEADGKWDIKKHHDDYVMLCKFHHHVKSPNSYRKFLNGVRDGAKKKQKANSVV